MALLFAVKNEIDKITEGAIPEFRDSFVKWGAVVVCMRHPETG